MTTLFCRATPVRIVQRNSGIDAIHNQFINERPVVIRVQREGEDLIEAAVRLEKAGKKKQAAAMILIQTFTGHQNTFLNLLPEGIRVIKSTKLSLEEFPHDIADSIRLQKDDF